MPLMYPQMESPSARLSNDAGFTLGAAVGTGLATAALCCARVCCHFGVSWARDDAKIDERPRRGSVFSALQVPTRPDCNKMTTEQTDPVRSFIVQRLDAARDRRSKSRKKMKKEPKR